MDEQAWAWWAPTNKKTPRGTGGLRVRRVGRTRYTMMSVMQVTSP
ncbi:hypothetical protein [Cellulomonas carbonis]|nr:hypothetical protein [Cellulomonas carbonis]